MRRFLMKITSIFTFIVAIMVLQSWLSGSLPFVAVLTLLPAFALLTVRLFWVGTRSTRKQARHTAAQRAPQRMQPVVQVAMAPKTPGGSRAA